jgi:pimeloyl-ACP methyl ester carboxylesterase
MRPKLFTPATERAVVEHGRELVLGQDADELVAAVEAIRDRPDSSDLVGSLEAPVVVAVGEHDPFLSVDEAGEIGGRLRVFEGVGHLPSLERPDDFTRLLRELVE